MAQDCHQRISWRMRNPECDRGSHELGCVAQHDVARGRHAIHSARDSRDSSANVEVNPVKGRWRRDGVGLARKGSLLSRRDGGDRSLATTCHKESLDFHAPSVWICHGTSNLLSSSNQAKANATQEQSAPAFLILDKETISQAVFTVAGNGTAMCMPEIRRNGAKVRINVGETPEK